MGLGSFGHGLLHFGYILRMNAYWSGTLFANIIKKWKENKIAKGID